MHDTPSRLAVALLLLAGLLTVGLSAGAAAGLPAQASDALLAAWHRQLLAAMTGAGLLVAAFVPAARVAAAAAAMLEKAGFLAVTLAAGRPLGAGAWADAAMLLALAAAVAVWARQARQEARWEGVLPL